MNEIILLKIWVQCAKRGIINNTQLSRKYNDIISNIIIRQHFIGFPKIDFVFYMKIIDIYISICDIYIIYQTVYFILLQKMDNWK
jgi:hypothetical protein